MLKSYSPGDEFAFGHNDYVVGYLRQEFREVRLLPDLTLKGDRASACGHPQFVLI